jgi:hypothetical protein
LQSGRDNLSDEGCAFVDPMLFELPLNFARGYEYGVVLKRHTK